MNLEFVVALSEVIGAIALVISLVYVGVQIHQNTVSQNALVHQQLLESQTSANRAIVDNETVSDLLDRANRDLTSLTPSELIKINFVFFNFFN